MKTINCATVKVTFDDGKTATATVKPDSRGDLAWDSSDIAWLIIHAYMATAEWLKRNDPLHYPDMSVTDVVYAATDLIDDSEDLAESWNTGDYDAFLEGVADITHVESATLTLSV